MHEEVGRGHRHVVPKRHPSERPHPAGLIERLPVPPDSGVIVGQGSFVLVDPPDSPQNKRGTGGSRHPPRVLQPLRLEEVVRVQDRNVIAFTEGDRAVYRFVGSAVLLVDDPHAVERQLFEHVPRPVRRAVIHDDQVARRKRLGAHTFDGPPDEALVVVGGNDDGQDRPRPGPAGGTPRPARGSRRGAGRIAYPRVRPHGPHQSAEVRDASLPRVRVGERPHR